MPERRMTDQQMMAAVDQWPHWPILPVKRWNTKEHSYDCAVMAELFGHQFDVFQISLVQLGAGRLGDLLKDVPFLHYESYDDIVNNGWLVD